MNKLILLILFFTSILFSQDWKETYDVWNDLGHTVSDADSVFLTSSGYPDSLVIHGPETVHIFIPQDFDFGDADHPRSNGAVRIAIISYSIKGAGVDTVFASLGNNLGTYNATKTGWTNTYSLLDTLAMAYGGTAQIDLFPMSNTTLQDEFANYYDLKLVGQNNGLRRLYIKIEWMRAN